MFKQTTSIIFFFVLLFIFMVAVKFLNVSFPVTVTNTSRSTELSVVGEGKVEVVPDTAKVDVGISVQKAATVEAAQAEMDKTNNAIITAMKALGIDKKNIQTSNYSIYPAYDYSSGTEVANGYSGNVSVSIKTTNIAQVSEVIEAATKAGANQVQGTSFQVENPDKYREQARNMAIENAKAQAQQLANSLGIKLGKVVNIVEYSPTSGNPGVMYDMAVSNRAMGGGGGATIEAGSQEITSVVTLYFEKR